MAESHSTHCHITRPSISLIFTLFLLCMIFTHASKTQSGIITLTLVRPALDSLNSQQPIEHMILTTPHCMPVEALTSPCTQHIAPSGFTLQSKRSTLVHFNMSALAPGPYMIEIVSAHHEYPLLRLDISAKTGNVRLMRNDAAQKVIRPHSSTGGGIQEEEAVDVEMPQIPSVTTYRIHPTAPIKYFIEHQPFTITHHLKNPMVLIALFSIAVIVFMPMLAQSESMKEVQSMIGDGEDVLGGWLDSMKEKTKR